ncbi:MAG: hypothetical protein U1G05_03035 [Kiritimatiellia bacterium]
MDHHVRRKVPRRLEGRGKPHAASRSSGGIVVNGTRGHLFYLGADGKASFKDFEFQAEGDDHPGSNSGIFIHTALAGQGLAHPRLRDAGQLLALRLHQDRQHLQRDPGVNPAPTRTTSGSPTSPSRAGASPRRSTTRS